MNKLGIYIHVPFCVQKCRYCDFYSLSSGNDGIFAEYRDALIRHFAMTAEKASVYTVDSIYFGGGTPSVLPSDMLCVILDSLRKNFRIDPNCEITLEMNPKTASRKAFDDYINGGFNRLSVGCQSANDNELKMLGRLHSFSDFCETVNLAKQAGFSNISADLMMGLPNQTWAHLSNSIDRIAETSPTHISVYGLKIEKGTWFDKHRPELALPDEDTESMLYLNTVEKLSSLEYGQYEISNFAKRGYESRHNLKYWHGECYLGYGPAAYSCFENHRYGYKRDLASYISATKNRDFSLVLQDEEYLSKEDQTEEKLLLNLRLKEGIILSDFSFDAAADEFINKLLSENLAKLSNGRFSLTPCGMLVDNYITSELLLYLI